MVGILDIAPVPSSVDVDGQAVDVPGISAEGIAFLLQEFPQFDELRRLMTTDDKSRAADLGALLFKMGPQIINQILAAGCGYPGNQKAIDRVSKLDLTSQTDLLDAILKKTLSKGLDHFLAGVQSIRATLTPPKGLAEKIQESVARKQRSSSASSSSSGAQATLQPTSGA